MAWRTIGRGLIAGALAIAGISFVVVQGCKKKQQEARYVQPPPIATPDAAASAPPAKPDLAAPDAAAGDGGPKALDLVTMQAMQDFIRERAKKQAKGMKPYSDFFGGVVEEGGTVEQTIMIDAGKCYGVIAMGSPGVAELDIQIQAKPGLPIPLPGPVIAVDSNTGPEAAVSPCWKNPFPLSFPALVVLKATRGKGPIGGQTYVK